MDSSLAYTMSQTNSREQMRSVSSLKLVMFVGTHRLVQKATSLAI